MFRQRRKIAAPAPNQIADAESPLDGAQPPDTQAVLAVAMQGPPVLDPGRCTAEGSCVRSCPAAAITLTPAGRGRRQWRIDYGACVFCGRCQEACLPRAITLDGEQRLAAVHRRDLIATHEVREPKPNRPPAPGESYWRNL